LRGKAYGQKREKKKKSPAPINLQGKRRSSIVGVGETTTSISQWSKYIQAKGEGEKYAFAGVALKCRRTCKPQKVRASKWHCGAEGQGHKAEREGARSGKECQERSSDSLAIK